MEPGEASEHTREHHPDGDAASNDHTGGRGEGTRVGERARARLLAVTLGVAALGYAVDRLTKHWALTSPDRADAPTMLGGWISLQLVHNSGAAFSLGSGKTVIFSLLAIAALVGLVVWGLPRVRHWTTAVAAGMALAGIAGNLTDRLIRAPGVLRGEVVDFISLRHFAVFNVADILITAAAALVVLLSFTTRPSERES